METGVLPKYSDLSSDQTTFLDQHFGASDDLLSDVLSCLLSELQTHCSDLDSDLLRLRRWLSKSTVLWISRSFATKSELHSLAIDQQNLSLLTSQHGKISHGEELPKLTEEVLRIEGIRSYVETTLRLEALVGDLEDAVSCFMNRQTGNVFSAKPSNSTMQRDSGAKHEKLLQVIKSMNDIEDALVNLAGSQKTHWHRLLKSVDSRVDQNLGILRPQVLADHRALLNSLGWPPKLSASKIENGLVSDIPNPLTIMQGEKKKSYSNSFIALCALQHFQTQRETRRLNISGRNTSNACLWAIDELVSPIGSRMEYHFSKWTDQPELIFALAHRIARNFITGIDDVLQPLIDKARLVSCSAREAWVSAIVKMLSKYLEVNFLPSLANKYKDQETRHQVIPPWLHLVDLIIPFDKNMRTLVSLEGLSSGSSLLNMFCDRPDWLKIWAKIELKNACKKLKIDMQDEKCWRFDNKSQSESESERDRYIFSTREDHKAPPISESAVSIAREMIERSQTMTCVLPRVRFIRSTAGKFIWYVLRLLLFRHKGIELSLENFGDSSSRACSLINGARYIEFKLSDDDVDFIEMKIAENKLDKQEGKAEDGCFFGNEIASLSELETNWLMNIIVFVLRRFETLSWDYIKEARHLEEVSAAVDLPVSIYFIEALDELKSQLRALKMDLNAKDFSDLWRHVADGLDHFVSFSGIFLKIRDRVDGISQFENDMEALFSVFKPFCVRTEAFFPNIKKGLELLIVSRKRIGVKEYASTSHPMEKD